MREDKGVSLRRGKEKSSEQREAGTGWTILFEWPAAMGGSDDWMLKCFLQCNGDAGGVSLGLSCEGGGRRCAARDQRSTPRGTAHVQIFPRQFRSTGVEIYSPKSKFKDSVKSIRFSTLSRDILPYIIYLSFSYFSQITCTRRNSCMGLWLEFARHPHTWASHKMLCISPHACFQSDLFPNQTLFSDYQVSMSSRRVN